MSLGVQEPLLDRLPVIEPPTLLVVGEPDERFRRLAADMAARLRDPEIAVLAASGHAAHLERPRRFAAAVADFLSRHCVSEGGRSRWR
jgi:2-succinyl-6-hydroxy-2,4-cyclohexadiene-1-carboxylate synthase